MNSPSSFNQSKESFIVLPLCSLKTAGILILSSHLILVLSILLSVPRLNLSTELYFNCYTNVYIKQSTYIFHSINTVLSILSSLPILCIFQKKMLNSNPHSILQAKTFHSNLTVFKLNLILIPIFFSIVWSNVHMWINGINIYINLLTMIQSAIFIGVFSYVWLLIYRPPNTSIAQLEEANLQHLNTVIRPHFFFNALNAIMGLIRSDSKQAELILQDTAELFRSVMNQNQNRLVPLEIELDTCKQYTRIEQIRLDTRLRLNWDIDNTVLSVSVPPFCLQPLIENAIRHGIEPILNGGSITISVQRKSKYLILKVINPVKSIGSNQYIKPHIYSNFDKKDIKQPFIQHNGMALNNIKHRLYLMYADDALFKYGITNHTYQAVIILPLEI